jgi:hypothetical protein
MWYSLFFSFPYAHRRYAQASNNSSQAMAVDQLASNLTQAGEATASGNTTATTAQLTAIIGKLSDILGTVTSDPNGKATDKHTHFFVHKCHTHTVTHTPAFLIDAIVSNVDSTCRYTQ